MVQTAYIARKGQSARQPRLLYWLSLAIICLLFLLSPMMLTMLGVRYELEGGSVIEKLHPAHLLLLATLVLVMLSHRRLGVFFDHVFIHHKGSLIFLATWLVLMFQIIVVQKLPFTPVIDTFILPIGMLILLSFIGSRDRLKLAHLVHAFMLANALLGLVEFVSGWRLTPIVANGMVLSDEWRASALFGHPLANAVLTGMYLVILPLGGWRDVPWSMRPLLFGASLLAMNAFGGRAALVLLLMFLLVIFGLKALNVLAGQSMQRRDWLLTALIVPVMGITLFAGFELGLFDKFVGRFTDDNGSASARVILLEIFADLPLSAVLWGPDPAHVGSLLRNYGINFGIESFWIAFILSYGLIVSLIFFAGLFAFLYDVIRTAGPLAFWPLLYYLLICSTYVSLSAKSTDLGVVVMMIVLMLSQKSRPAPRPVGRVSASGPFPTNEVVT